METIAYEPVRPAPRPRLPAAMLVVLMASAGQLLFCYLNPLAPLRQGFGRDTPIARQAAQQVAFENQLSAKVGGRSIQLHFVEPSPPTPATGMIACGMYYATNYALWPNRAVVGDGRAVVNDTDTLRAADHVPAALVGRTAVVDVDLRPGGRGTVVTPTDGGRR